MPSLTEADFLQRLEEEAQHQAQLNQTRLLPEKLSGLARFVATYPWQTILLLSAVSALLMWRLT